MKSAFVNFEIKEEIYIAQPEQFVKKGKEEYGPRLKKSLYGLKHGMRLKKSL